MTEHLEVTTQEKHEAISQQIPKSIRLGRNNPQFSPASLSGGFALDDVDLRRTERRSI